MKLYPIHATGIKAYCSDMVVDPHDPDTVYFMSVCGYQTTVKGIIANFLEGYSISLEVEGTDHYLTRSSLEYKVKLRKLPSGLVHAVLLPKLALPGSEGENQNSFFVFTKESRAKQALFFRHLDEKTDIPMHPSWAEWLWQLFEQQESWLDRLKTLIGDYKGYSFCFNPKTLHDLISQAIRNKVPEVIRCMDYKGGCDGNPHFS
ncbi:MAG: hypothetical protein SWQ30_19335 [Thermodesulfobacteriota bacterium]|nr:hypothetical protein [Thermodesulfobacteriota bacterium]